MSAVIQFEANKLLPHALATLVEELSVSETHSQSSLEQILQRLEISATDLSTWLKFDDRCYRRNLLYRCDDFEILVLTWHAGQWSPIHNHRGSVCAVKVIEGTASEISFAKNQQGTLFPMRTEHYKTGSICVSTDEDIHQIANLQPEGTDLISLHIYSPPLKGMDLFPLSQSTFAAYDQLLIQSIQR